MPHKLIRLAAKVFNTPQLISAEEFKPITEYLSKRSFAGMDSSRRTTTYGALAGLSIEESVQIKKH